MSVWRAREAKNVATYGTARWATPREVRAARLLGPAGVVLGRFGREYLRHDGPEHVLCFAPTRSGKGVGLVVPPEEIAPAPAKPTTEFTFAEENSDDEVARASILRRQARSLARQAAMDPNDGLGL